MEKVEYWLIYELTDGERYIDIFDCPREFEDYKKNVLFLKDKITLWEERKKFFKGVIPAGSELIRNTLP